MFHTQLPGALLHQLSRDIQRRQTNLRRRIFVCQRKQRGPRDGARFAKNLRKRGNTGGQAVDSLASRFRERGVRQSRFRPFCFHHFTQSLHQRKRVVLRHLQTLKRLLRRTHVPRRRCRGEGREVQILQCIFCFLRKLSPVTFHRAYVSLTPLDASQDHTRSSLRRVVALARRVPFSEGALFLPNRALVSPHPSLHRHGLFRQVCEPSFVFSNRPLRGYD
mmetsp:Transcript_8346/g.27806  ORF Transcript_8346/g.27806 Transcript_8346/m.27806 type:complete len:220 (+) Transcript_8346:322-981(+)